MKVYALPDGGSSEAEQGPPDWNDPIEYEVAEVLAWEAGHTYSVLIWLDTGDIGWEYEFYGVCLRHPRECIIFFSKVYDDTGAHGKNLVLACEVSSPISIEHATEVAREKREEWLRARSPELPTS